MDLDEAKLEELACEMLEKGEEQWEGTGLEEVDEEVRRVAAEIKASEVLEAEARSGLEWHRDWLAPGRSLGSYRVEKLLDNGGWGFVYGVEKDGEKWAGQLLWKEEGRRERALRGRVEEVGRLELAALMRPELVEVEVRGEMRLVAVSRRRLGAPLKDRGRVEEEEIVRVLRAMLGTLGGMHRDGVVHGDLSPSALFLEDGGGVGVCGLLGGTLNEGRSREERSRSLLRYGAPEVVMDGEAASPQSDMYSLGLVAYEALKGRLPWESGSSVVDLVRRTVGRVEVQTSSVGLGKFLEGCLRGQAGMRWSCAEKAAEALDE